MLAYALKRSFAALLILIVVSALTFSLSHLSADPALTIGGAQASDEDIEAIRLLYGFDRPIYVQYFDWATRALSGDFGESYHYGERVSEMILSRIGTTMTLGTLALLFALVISIPLGVVAAMRPNSLIDRFALLIAVFGQALPTFWFALMMIIVRAWLLCDACFDASYACGHDRGSEFGLYSHGTGQGAVAHGGAFQTCA